jgi:hypothetical protein
MIIYNEFMISGQITEISFGLQSCNHIEDNEPMFKRGH